MYTINYHHVLLSHYNISSLVNLPHNHLQRLYYGHAFLSQEILPYHVLSGIFVLRKMSRNQPRNKLWQVIYFIVPFFSLFWTGLLFLIMYWCARLQYILSIHHVTRGNFCCNMQQQLLVQSCYWNIYTEKLQEARENTD
jgi:hypothetical protein